MFSKYKFIILALIVFISLFSHKAVAEKFTIDESILLNPNKNLEKNGVQVKGADSSLCVDVPEGENPGIVHMWECFRKRHLQSTSSKTVNASQRQSTSWILPWSKGVKGIRTQKWHSDGWSRNKSFDMGLPAGTPVLAPIDSKVIAFCNAGNNHLAIRLQSHDGKMYSLIHVKSSTVSKNKKYKQGEQMGVIAGDRPWNRCAKSTGPHLHFSLPNQNFTIGGYKISPSFIPRFMISNN